MAGIQLPGLATGLDSTKLIAEMLRVGAIPQTLLKNKVATNTTKITDFQALNTKIAALIDLAKANKASNALRSFKVDSTDTSVTATADKTAVGGSIDLTVSKLASSQLSVTGPMTAWPSDPPVLTVVKADGTKTVITAASTNLDDVAKAINISGTGVTATKVAAGKDAAGNVQYRLQIQSVETGAASAFQVYQGSATEVTAGTAPDLLAQPGAVTLRTASDAEIKLFAGTSAEQTITSPKNTFTDLLAGVDVTVSKVSSSPVTVTIGQDTSAAAQTAASFMSALSAIFSLISIGSATATSTNAAGDTILTPGSFTGDPTVRDAGEQIIRAAADPVNGISPGEIGFNLTKEGTIEFDIDKFKQVLTSDPNKAESMFAAIASRVQQAAVNVGDSYTGTLTSKIKNAESEVKTLNDQVADWDLRLAKRKDTLITQYAALETAISKINSQSSYLASQIAGLPTYSSSSSK